jgi:hypothetical protein
VKNSILKIDNNGHITEINKPYDLYELYTDFLSINDDSIREETGEEITKEEEKICEEIRDNYEEIFKRIYKKKYHVLEFERKAIKLLKKIK